MRGVHVPGWAATPARAARPNNATKATERIIVERAKGKEKTECTIRRQIDTVVCWRLAGFDFVQTFVNR